METKSELEELIDHLGFGIPRILEAYPPECFKFPESIIPMTFFNGWDLSEDNEITYLVNMQDTMQDTMQVTPQVTPKVAKLILTILCEQTRDEIQKSLGLFDRKSFRVLYMKEALKLKLIELTIPDKPNSRLQKYRLTEKGEALQKQLKK